jgi:RimJ/RimL family protein N-acetyltransferase
MTGGVGSTEPPDRDATVPDATVPDATGPDATVPDATVPGAIIPGGGTGLPGAGAGPGVSVEVRRADPGDAAALVALASAVSGESEGWLLSDSTWRSVGDERRYIRALRRHPNAALYVADTKGILIGRLSLTRDPNPASAHVADLGLMVAASHRRQGVGTALLRTAERWAREAKVTKLELHVFPHNAPAIALYEHLDYVQEGVRRDHYRLPDGRLVDAILMAKQLG